MKKTMISAAIAMGLATGGMAEEKPRGITGELLFNLPLDKNGNFPIIEQAPLAEGLNNLVEDGMDASGLFDLGNLTLNHPIVKPALDQAGLMNIQDGMMKLGADLIVCTSFNTNTLKPFVETGDPKMLEEVNLFFCATDDGRLLTLQP